MEEAAIAYNKAIDILKKNGCKKNYTPNYLENVPAGMYADIYTCRFLKKYTSFTFRSSQ